MGKLLGSKTVRTKTLKPSSVLLQQTTNRVKTKQEPYQTSGREAWNTGAQPPIETGLNATKPRSRGDQYNRGDKNRDAR
jgi:hypothetical protein